MKTFPGASSQSIPGLRKKRSHKSLPDEIHQIAHHLFNQLSVINLCSFKLKDTLRVGRTASSDLDLLERAVGDATEWAERLSQVIFDSVPTAKLKKPAPAKAAEQTSNVVPLFAQRRR
jgi:hypothetical protein